MTATAAQIAQVRRMVNEPDDTTYDDDAISGYIEDYPRLDERGEVPYTWDTSTSPPTQDDNDDWIPTYDLAAAAADIWAEKAAILAQDYNFRSADGASFNRREVYEQYMNQSRYYRSRRKPSTHKLAVYPDMNGSKDPDWVINEAEDD
jgi:hypothetical protein